jgi:hypothetical protein
MLEILAAYMYENGRKIPNAIKKGFSLALGRFDEYSLAKYKGENHDIKLIDLVNLIHPIPTEKNAEALKKLVKGELKSKDTWESGLSQAGQEAEDEAEKAENKKEVWKDLILNKKIKYFALLRNLRNIAEQCPEVLDEALKMLVDEKSIKKSLVLPFRFTTAFNVIEESDLNSSVKRKINSAIDSAIEISLENVPSFEGNTLVAIDSSGSMQGRCSQIATLFGAVLAKKNNADIINFEYIANYVNYLPNDSISSIVNKIPFMGGGTNFHSIFEKADKAYDRIIILSDMQGWVGFDSPYKTSFKKYKDKYDCEPIIYSFDLAGYGNMQFPENKVYCLAGFSDKIFDIMKFCESNKDALIDEIEKIEI